MVHAVQAAAPASVLAHSAPHHAWACTLAALAALPRPTVPATAARSSLLPLTALFPHSAFMSAHLHSVYRRTHQLCGLRVDLARLSASPAVSTALPFVLASSAAYSGRTAGHHHVRKVFETALAGTSMLETALQLAKGRGTHSAGTTAGLEASNDAMGALDSFNFAAIAEKGVHAAGTVGSAALDNAPVLWLAYVQWLTARGACTDAENVLLRGVSACPWCKGLWLQGLYLLAPQVADRFSEKWLKVMDERGVPMATELTEVLLLHFEDTTLVDK